MERHAPLQVSGVIALLVLLAGGGATAWATVTAIFSETGKIYFSIDGLGTVGSPAGARKVSPVIRSNAST